MKILLLLLFCVPLSCGPLVAQSTRQSVKSELCTQENALRIVNEQIAAAKTIDDPVRRISLTLRGADLLWAYQTDKSELLSPMRLSWRSRVSIPNTTRPNGPVSD
jgi:hypothetical protein